jgi:hypothetical protein
VKPLLAALDRHLTPPRSVPEAPSVPKPAADPASPHPPPALAEFPVVVRIPVAWGDMDAKGPGAESTHERL